MFKFVAGLGIFGGLLAICLGIVATVCTIVGLVVSFSASILVGIIVLVIEPAPFIIGLVYLWNGNNLAEAIAKLIGG